ncbi:MAG: DUF4097 family beta strand repeat-containing protein [Candidatus Coproplasma sp.]
MKKVNKLIFAVFAAVAAVAAFALCAFCGCGYTNGAYWTDVDYANESAYTVGDGEIEESISEIAIDWVCDDVTVKNYAVSNVKLEETADKEIDEALKLRYLVDNGKLTVQFATNGRHDIKGLNKKLTVLVPMETALDKLDIKSVSGNIETVASVNELYVNNVSGSVTVNGVISSVHVNTVSGAINIVGGGVLQANSVSGNIRLYTNGASDIDVSTVSGNIDLALNESLGFTLTFKTTSGKFSSALATTKDGNTYTRLEGGVPISAKTTSGNLNIIKYVY